MEQNNALARKFNAASLLRFALPNIAMMMLLSMYTIVAVSYTHLTLPTT